jgi:hypothetical protein
MNRRSRRRKPESWIDFLLSSAAGFVTGQTRITLGGLEMLP